MKIICLSMFFILLAFILIGCATPRAPFARGDSGRMSVQLYRARVPVKSEFEMLVETKTFSACVSISSTGVIGSCSDN